MDVVHRARPGDTLAAIAWDYAVPLDELLRFNGIKHPALLWVGQEVRIPNACSVMPPVPEGLGAEPPDVPVDVAHFSTAMKVSKALELSWKSWPGQVAESARDAFSDPTFLVTLVIIMGVYVGLWLTPDPTMITKVLAGTLTVVLLAQFAWEDIYGLAEAWFKLGVECERATTQAQLQKAGDTFARKVGQVGFDLLLFLVMWRAGKAAEPKLRDLGLKRMEARAEAEVKSAAAQPGSGVSRKVTGAVEDVLDAARRQSRGSTPTSVLDALSNSLPESSREGLTVLRARLGDAIALDRLARMAGKEDLKLKLADEGASIEQRAAAKKGREDATARRGHVRLLRLNALRDTYFRGDLNKHMRGELIHYVVNLLKSLKIDGERLCRQMGKGVDVNELVGSVGEAIQRAMLSDIYPASRGYIIWPNVEIVRLVEGFKTKAEWMSAERAQGRDGKPKGLYDWEGLLWKSITEMDAVVGRKTRDGRFRPEEIEQMKTGKNDSPSDAASQNKNAIDSLRKISEGDSSIRLAERVGKNTLSRNLTDRFDLSRLNEVRCSGRGIEGKGFDRDIPFDRDTLVEVVAALLKPAAHAKRVVPERSLPVPPVVPQAEKPSESSSR